MLDDQGTELGDLLANFSTEHNVIFYRTEIASHSSLALFERHHQPLRTIYNKMKHEYPNISTNLDLQFSVK